MEEGKKRYRPSLGAYRALENEVSELREQLRLSERSEKLVSEELREVIGKNRTLEQSQRGMEQARKDMLAEIARLSNALEHSQADVLRLRSRGFWARVFNRE